MTLCWNLAGLHASWVVWRHQPTDECMTKGLEKMGAICRNYIIEVWLWRVCLVPGPSFPFSLLHGCCGVRSILCCVLYPTTGPQEQSQQTLDWNLPSLKLSMVGILWAQWKDHTMDMNNNTPFCKWVILGLEKYGCSSKVNLNVGIGF